MNVNNIILPSCPQNEYLEYYKTGNYPLKHIIEEPIEYKKKFSLVKQKFRQKFNIQKLTSVIKISHLKQTIDNLFICFRIKSISSLFNDT